MLAAKDISLAEETIRELQARGEDERANALEAVLAVATSALAGQWPTGPREYLTTGQVARALGLSSQTIRTWVVSGQLRSVRPGRQALVHREEVLRLLAELHEGRPLRRKPMPGQAEAARERLESVVAALPADKLARLEALHEKMEDGERLSRTDLAEMAALEREITDAAGQHLVHWNERHMSPAE